MINFTKIKIQNFMSAGNAPIEIDYMKNSTTLVTAKNGSGKSALMLDSITFALYGKPYRNINKPQLVNTVNQKDCLVEIWFTVGKTKYHIKRGIRPVVFEIYKDGKLLNQDAASRDYQKVLEQSILKMNYRTFTQVVIMGSGNYIPFMRLPLAQRREFIEDVLDIKIFSSMNQILKQKMSDAKEAKRELDVEIKSLKEKVRMQQEFIATLESTKTDQISEFVKNIDSLMLEIGDADSKILALKEKESTLNEELAQSSDIDDIVSTLKSTIAEYHRSIKKVEREQVSFKSIDVCPTCHQGIESSHRDMILSKMTTEITDMSSIISKHDASLNDLGPKLALHESLRDELLTIQASVGELNTTITAANRIIKKYNQQIEDLQSNNGSVEVEQAKLKALAKDVVSKTTKKSEINEQEFYHDVAAALLKDTGIKTKIIKQYLPIFNTLINKFLQQLDFFVSFNLDENFNEVVKSRHRDTFTYESFSEGEKQRLDLALLFTFREIARLKNSLHVNLLLMDEIADQSLDAVGIENLFSIIEGLEKSNVFIISHREGLADKFDGHVHLTKRGNFTEIGPVDL